MPLDVLTTGILLADIDGSGDQQDVEKQQASSQDTSQKKSTSKTTASGSTDSTDQDIKWYCSMTFGMPRTAYRSMTFLE